MGPGIVGHLLGDFGELGDRQLGASGLQRHLAQEMARHEEFRGSLGDSGERFDGLAIAAGPRMEVGEC